MDTARIARWQDHERTASLYMDENGRLLVFGTFFQSRESCLSNSCYVCPPPLKKTRRYANNHGCYWMHSSQICDGRPVHVCFQFSKLLSLPIDACPFEGLPLLLAAAAVVVLVDDMT